MRSLFISSYVRQTMSFQPFAGISVGESAPRPRPGSAASCTRGLPDGAERPAPSRMDRFSSRPGAASAPPSASRRPDASADLRLRKAVIMTARMPNRMRHSADDAAPALGADTLGVGERDMTSTGDDLNGTAGSFGITRQYRKRSLIGRS